MPVAGFLFPGAAAAGSIPVHDDCPGLPLLRLGVRYVFDSRASHGGRHQRCCHRRLLPHGVAGRHPAFGL